MIDQADVLAQVLWDYHVMNQPVRPADAIMVLGNNDIRVAERGVDLFKQNYAPIILFCGGSGRLTQDWKQSEAEVFAQRARELGISDEVMILEPNSTNTGDNILFTQRLLADQGLDPKSFILVHKPYMERRTFATFSKLWPGKDFTVTSPQLSMAEFIAGGPTCKDEVIQSLVGYLQRIIEYPNRGFQIPQQVPPEVMSAYQRLIDLGYTKRLI